MLLPKKEAPSMRRRLFFFASVAFQILAFSQHEVFLVAARNTALSAAEGAAILSLFVAH